MDQPPVTHAELGRLLVAVGGTMRDHNLSFASGGIVGGDAGWAALDGLSDDRIVDDLYRSHSPPATPETHSAVLVRSKWVRNSLDPDSVEGLDYSESSPGWPDE